MENIQQPAVQNTYQPAQQIVIKPNMILPRILIGFSILRIVFTTVYLFFVVPNLVGLTDSLHVSSSAAKAYQYGIILIVVDLLQIGYAILLIKKQKNIAQFNKNYIKIGWIIFIFTFFFAGSLLAQIQNLVLSPIYHLTN